MMRLAVAPPFRWWRSPRGDHQHGASMARKLLGRFNIGLLTRNLNRSSHFYFQTPVEQAVAVEFLDDRFSVFGRDIDKGMVVADIHFLDQGGRHARDSCNKVADLLARQPIVFASADEEAGVVFSEGSPRARRFGALGFPGRTRFVHHRFSAVGLFRFRLPVAGLASSANSAVPAFTPYAANGSFATMCALAAGAPFHAVVTRSASAARMLLFATIRQRC